MVNLNNYYSLKNDKSQNNMKTFTIKEKNRYGHTRRNNL